MLGELAQELVAAHGGFVELHALVAVALGDLLAPHEDPGPDALRAGIPAPDPAGEHGDEEQAEGADDQQAGEQDEILWPEGGAEDVELPLGEVPPYGLPVIPGQPDSAEIKQEEDGPPAHSQVSEETGEGAGVDFFTGGIKVDVVTAALLGRGDIMNGNLFAHQCVPRRWEGALSVHAEQGQNYACTLGNDTACKAPSRCDRWSRWSIINDSGGPKQSGAGKDRRRSGVTRKERGGLIRRSSRLHPGTGCRHTRPAGGPGRCPGALPAPASGPDGHSGWSAAAERSRNRR
ncbi:hypothetical protein D3C76_817130 [compost metagenome]